MITESAASSRHLDDAELVRHMDNEGDAAERERWQAHLGECIACTREVATLREQSRKVSAWLARADEEESAPVVEESARERRPNHAAARGLHAVPPTRSRSNHFRFRAAPLWLRLAASLVLVAGPLAAYAPVRAWVSEQVAAFGSNEAPTAATPFEAAADGPVSDVPMDPIVRFIPTGGRFSVVLGAAQAEGGLAIVRSEGPEALLASDNPSIPTFVSGVLLRIENSAESSASYTLSLPSSVVELDLVIAGRTTRLDRAALDSGQTINLSP